MPRTFSEQREKHFLTSSSLISAFLYSFVGQNLLISSSISVAFLRPIS